MSVHTRRILKLSKTSHQLCTTGDLTPGRNSRRQRHPPALDDEELFMELDCLLHVCTRELQDHETGTMDLPLRLDGEVNLLVLETGTSTTVFTGEENGPRRGRPAEGAVLGRGHSRGGGEEGYDVLFVLFGPFWKIQK